MSNKKTINATSKKPIKKKHNYENCKFCIKNNYYGCIECSTKPIKNYGFCEYITINKYKIIAKKVITKVKNSNFHQFLYLIKHNDTYKYIYDIHIVYYICNLCKCCYTDSKSHYSIASHKRFNNLFDIRKTCYVNASIPSSSKDEFLALNFFNYINKKNIKNLQKYINKKNTNGYRKIKDSLHIDFLNFSDKLFTLFNKHKKQYEKEYSSKMIEKLNMLKQILPNDLCTYIMEWC